MAEPRLYAILYNSRVDLNLVCPDSVYIYFIFYKVFIIFLIFIYIIVNVESYTICFMCVAFCGYLNIIAPVVANVISYYFPFSYFKLLSKL